MEGLLNVLILGASTISHNMAEAINRPMTGCRVAKIYARGETAEKRERATKLADKYQCPVVIGDYRDAILDPEIDIVYIGLPTHLHCDAIVESVRANKRGILCDKALVMNLEELKRVEEALSEYGGVFAEGLMFHSSPFIKAFLEKVPLVGEIKHITAYMTSDISKFTNPIGGDVFHHMSVYPMSLALRVCGNIEVEMQGAANKNNLGLYSSAAALIHTKSGAFIQLTTADNFGVAKITSKFVVYGSKGQLEINSSPFMIAPGENEFTFTSFETKKPEVHKIQISESSYAYQFKELADAIKSGKMELDHLPRQFSFDHFRAVMEWRNSVK